METNVSKQVPFYITSGLPFGKTIVVDLPNGRSWWTLINQFEVLSQAREGTDVTSPLIVDLAQYMTIDLVGDVVTITLTMNGSQTRLVTKSGNYDVILSDVLPTDDRAIKVLDGPVYRNAIVTSDTGVV